MRDIPHIVGRPKIYATYGINWFFPYSVEYEDDDILILRELPRCHKYDRNHGADEPVTAWIELGREWAIVNGQRKLVEVLEG